MAAAQAAQKATLAKWLSVRLRNKWLWVRVQLQSLKTIQVCLIMYYNLAHCKREAGADHVKIQN